MYIISNDYKSEYSSQYVYNVFIGKKTILPNSYSSYWVIKNKKVECLTTNKPFKSKKLCIEMVGYICENRTSTFIMKTEHPYINGCSTKELIPPARKGDPTMQLLFMPCHTSEQEHHIHTTDRVVYVKDGYGECVYGTPNNTKKIKLKPNMTLVIPKMTLHHFETQESSLTVIPFHVFSSIPNIEFDHPMMNGTKT